MGWQLPALFITGLVSGSAGAIIDRGFQHYADLSQQLFTQKFPNLAALASISLEDARNLPENVQAERIEAINALQAFSHAFTSAQLADDLTSSLGEENANNFARIIGDSLEKLTHNTPTAFNIGDEQRDLWNNDYGLNNLVGKTESEKADAIAVEIQKYLNDQPTEMKFEWDLSVDPRTLDGSQETEVSKEALDELGLLNPFFENLKGSALEGSADLFQLDSLQISSIPNIFSNLPQQFQAFLAQFEAVRTVRDPLVIDLDGNGFAGLVNNQVYFDMDADGSFAELARFWVAPGDGFIVWDANGNDRADDGAELFGNGSTDAWVRLAEHDDNSDGVIDGSDAIFTQLNIWRDANSDGITQNDEWFELSDFNIASVNIPASGSAGSVSTDVGDILVRGVTINTEANNTRYSGDVDIKFETLFLPEIRGFSTLPDLRIAMSLDDSVLARALDLAAQPLSDTFENFLAFRADFTQMMYEWAGVENIDPTSRGPFMSDARQLEFMEEYFSEAFFQARFVENNPLSLAAVALENTFTALQDDMMTKFIFQSGGAALFETDGAYDLASDTIVFDMNPPVLNEQALLNLGSAGAGVAEAEVFWANILFFIGAARGGLDTLSAQEIGFLDAAIGLSDPSLDFAGIDLQIVTGLSQNITGTDNADFLAGAAGADTLRGLGGNDTLVGNDGDDILEGGDGDDTLQGGAGFDRLVGGARNDVLQDGGGSDLMEGGDGDDLFVWSGDGTNDFITDSSGFDTIRVDNAQNIVFERVFGDGMILRLGQDTVTLEDQLADPALGLSFIESIEDENGNPVHDLTNLAAQIITQGTDGADTLFGIQFGASRNDDLRGNGGDDILLGGIGNDRLDGGDGNDSLFGGEGNDHLIGGRGDDFFSLF